MSRFSELPWSEQVKVIRKLRHLVWWMDIPSLTCPEYIEHHEDITEILQFIDTQLLNEDGDT